MSKATKIVLTTRWYNQGQIADEQLQTQLNPEHWESQLVSFASVLQDCAERTSGRPGIKYCLIALHHGERLDLTAMLLEHLSSDAPSAELGSTLQKALHEAAEEQRRASECQGTFQFQ